MLTRALQELGYDFREFLISPQQLNIPNSRLRYYLIARRKASERTCFPFSNEVIHEQLPQLNFECDLCDSRWKSHYRQTKEPLTSFIERLTHEQTVKHALSDNVLDKYSIVFDIVTENSLNSCCFTKGYRQLFKGTGSILQENSTIVTTDYFNELPRYEDDSSSKASALRIEKLKLLKLRYFTPREVANLMCFPSTFSFPKEVTEKQMYKVLGNSVNIDVVSTMLRYLLYANMVENE